MSNKIFCYQQFNEYTQMPNAACFGGYIEYLCVAVGQKICCHQISNNCKVAEGELEAAPSQLTVARSSTVGAAGFASGRMQIFDSVTMQMQKPFNAHRSAISALQMTSDGRHVASGSVDGNLRFWAIDGCQLIQNIDCSKQHMLKNGGMTTVVSNPTITSLAFNHNSSWVYIGDASGRVLIWDLTKMCFRVETWVYQGQNIGYAGAVYALFSHYLDRVMIVSDGYKAVAFSAQDGLLAAETPKRQGGFFGIFCPTKDSMVVSIRKNGVDIWDFAIVDYYSQLLRNSLEYRFGYILCCAQRSTSTIPQILVLTAERSGNVYLHVVSLKFIFPFCATDNPYAEISQVPGERHTVSAPRDYRPSMQVKTRPDPEDFLSNHARRIDVLNDKLLLLRQLNNRDQRDILEVIADFDDARIVCDVIYKFSVLKNLDIGGALRVFYIINKQLLKCRPNGPQEEFDTAAAAISVAQDTAAYFAYIVIDNVKFEPNGRGVDFGLEERYQRCRALVGEVYAFLGCVGGLADYCDAYRKTVLQSARNHVFRLYSEVLPAYAPATRGGW